MVPRKKRQLVTELEGYTAVKLGKFKNSYSIKNAVLVTAFFNGLLSPLAFDYQYRGQ